LRVCFPNTKIVYLLLIIFLWGMSYFDYTFSESPPFIIQENKDRPHNWNITDIKTIYGIIELEKSKMECSRINNFLDIPDIDSVKYSSDGRL
jgi:hypothetical protein